MRNWKFLLFSLIVIAITIGVAACGGGDDGPDVKGAGDYLEVGYNINFGTTTLNPGSTARNVTFTLGAGAPTKVIVSVEDTLSYGTLSAANASFYTGTYTATSFRLNCVTTVPDSGTRTVHWIVIKE